MLHYIREEAEEERFILSSDLLGLSFIAGAPQPPGKLFGAMEEEEEEKEEKQEEETKEEEGEKEEEEEEEEGKEEEEGEEVRR